MGWGVGWLTFFVAVELVLRTILGLLNDQLPRLDVHFEMHFLRNPQGLRLDLHSECEKCSQKLGSGATNSDPFVYTAEEPWVNVLCRAVWLVFPGLLHPGLTGAHSTTPALL